MTDSISVAALQMTSVNNLDTNLKQADALLYAASQAGVALAVLPEYFAWMGLADTDKLFFAELQGSGPIQDFLADAARRYSLWIVGGTIPIVGSVSGKVFNRSQVWSPEGECVFIYDKMHLFSFDNGTERYCESNTIQSGDEVKTMQLPWGKLGIGVCYDLRFPEFFRALQPVDLLALPAAFTYTTGAAHWNILLRARAIENQCYVIAAGQTGVHSNGRKTFGHSQIIDPWGVVLGQLLEEEGMVTATLSQLEVLRVRQSLPALKHRRLGISTMIVSDKGSGIL